MVNNLWPSTLTITHCHSGRAEEGWVRDEHEHREETQDTAPRPNAQQ